MRIWYGPDSRQSRIERKPSIVQALEEAIGADSLKKKEPKARWRPCKGIRVYSDFEAKAAVGRRIDAVVDRTPEVWRSVTILDYLLRESALRLPGYDEIYIILHADRPRVAVSRGTES